MLVAMVAVARSSALSVCAKVDCTALDRFVLAFVKLLIGTSKAI